MPRLLLMRGTIGSGKTSVATRIETLVPAVSVVEVDHIKRRRYGTSLFCLPAVDFVAAGKTARQSMGAGRDTIVVESFCQQQHLDWVLTAAGLALEAPNVSLVWLDCDLATSLQRKRRFFPGLVVRWQHRRYGSRFRAAKEHVFPTAGRSVEDIADQVLAATRLGIPAPADGGWNNGTFDKKPLSETILIDPADSV